MNMKRKRHLSDKDQSFRRSKKQKCQQTEVKQEDQSIQYQYVQDVIITSIEGSPTFIRAYSIEMDKETQNLGESFQNYKSQPPRQIISQLFDEEEQHISVGSLDPIDFSDTPAPSFVPSHSQTPDYLTPTLLLLIFNITLPTLDLYKDISMLIRLSSYPQYWAWGVFLFLGIFLNFLFTCLAWWRLEPRQKKSWTWILLLLQVKQARDRIIPPDSCPCRCGPRPGQSGCWC
jgi:hypothetical protein